MRHGDKLNNLGRTTAHRKALMSNLTCQLIEHKRITTTLAKAKALRTYAEPLITRSKSDSMHNRRVVFSHLQDKEAIKELFGTVGDKVGDRPGGYTRIIKLPNRLGDAAEMAMIELVDFNEIYSKDAKTGTTKKTRRSRRTGAPVKAGTAEGTSQTQEGASAEHAPEALDAGGAVAQSATHSDAAESGADQDPSPHSGADNEKAEGTDPAAAAGE